MSEKSYSKRSANFNSCEIDFLIKTITRYRDIIESKKIDRASAEEKAKAWKEVEREYNSQFEYNFRSAKVLKTKYDNLKKNAKKIIRQRDSDVCLKVETCPKQERCLEEIAFMDETTFSTDKLLSETVREYFEEDFPENEITSPSWHADEVDDAEDSDDREDNQGKDRYPTTNLRDQSLLVPMFTKSFQSSSRNNMTTSNGTIESRSSDNDALRLDSNKSLNSNTKKYRVVGCRSLNNTAVWESKNANATQKKSSIQLFCDSLALQIEEAQLTRYQLSSLQIDLLKKMQEYIPTDK